MAESIQRGRVWWHRQPDGTWLRWNADAGAWERSDTPPPAPAPPPSTAVTAPLRGEGRRPGAGSTAPLPALDPGHAGQEDVLPAGGSPPQAVAGAGAKSASTARPRRVDPRVLLVGGAVVLLAVLGFGAWQLLSDEGSPGAARRAGAERQQGGPEGPGQRNGVEKQEFIAAADALCRKTLDLQRALPPPQTRRELVRYLGQVRALSLQLYRKLRALPAPREDRRELEALFRLYERALAQLTLATRAARTGERVTVARAVRRATALGQAFNARATQYGFQECNKDE